MVAKSTRLALCLLVSLTTFPAVHPSQSSCNQSIREKYCNSTDAASCLRCEIGPTCPIVGGSRHAQDGALLLRGVEQRENLLEMLDKKRLSETLSTCVPLFEWDEDLAEVAQAWADQCAMIEYAQEGSGGRPQPRRLSHDPSDVRAAASKAEVRFPGTATAETGVAQTVHWARTAEANLTPRVMAELVTSEVRTEEGLIDGFMAGGNTSVIAWGQATHVGCGWIQFRGSGNGSGGEFENFLVCNYGIGVVNKTSCSNHSQSSSNQTPNSLTSFIKYYSASSEVIDDVKRCLSAVRCSRQLQQQQQQRLSPRDGGGGSGDEKEDKRCSSEVESCLDGRSGLKFLQPSQLKVGARSSDGAPIDVVRCKIDAILCSLNADAACQENLRRCVPLLGSAENGEQVGDRSLSECECSDLTLSDGTSGDCSTADELEGKKFCYVKRSPCLALGNDGQVEVSRPSKRLNGLVHVSFKLCENKSAHVKK